MLAWECICEIVCAWIASVSACARACHYWSLFVTLSACACVHACKCVCETAHTHTHTRVCVRFTCWKRFWTLTLVWPKGTATQNALRTLEA